MNQIVEENARTDGRMPQSYWDVEHSTVIEGYTTDFSVNAGNDVDFKINISDDPGSDYMVEVFRLGYYGGDGARMVASWTNTNGTVQPDAMFDATTGTADAGNWSVTDTWEIPEDAVAGVYLARVQRLDESGNPIEGAVNQIPFVVREDDRAADIVLQTSDTTWHAYNGWIGNNGEIGANFYGDSSGTIDHPDIDSAGDFAQDRAYAVSYNRPFITRGINGEQGGPAAGAQDYLFGAEYAAIYWLEMNGYDVSYMGGVDTDRLGADYLKKYESFLSVGHDEYWSGEQRYNVEEARDDGVNLLFWSGNEVYWKTRWETSFVDGQEYRTLVCYKETWAVQDPAAGPDDYYDLDPTDIWTGTWRDDRFIGNPLAGSEEDRPTLSGQPDLCNCAENSLTGQLFGPDATGEFGGALDVPADYSVLRVWRDTDIANGGALDIAPGILGYEWNTSPEDDYRPSGLIKLSDTTIPWSSILVDQGNTVQPGVATHNLSLYRADSGALVFGAGTVFWTWALTNNHDNEPYTANIENLAIQQFTVNMFADMGIQPAVADAFLASQGLVRASASTDFVAAVATIDELPETVAAGQPVLLTGTATDDDGDPLTDDGVVAVVELSFDGGTTWRVASGTTNWSYSWAPSAVQSYEILVRAIDDSLNMPVTSTLNSELVETTTPEAVTLFNPWTVFDGVMYDAGGALQIGTKFTTSSAGLVTELHYYRAATDSDDTDVRTGRLWTSDGVLLGTVTFTSGINESGWQTAALDSPAQLLAGQTYIVSYETADNYVGTVGQFGDSYADPFDLMSVSATSGGVFATGSGDILPTQSYQSTGYWVDVTFEPGEIQNDAPVFSSPTEFSVTENSPLAATAEASDIDGDPVFYSIAGGADASLFSIDGTTGKISFIKPPDFEAPDDSDGDNVYSFLLGALDQINTATTQSVTVTVTDDPNETDFLASTLFASGAAPVSEIVSDPTDYELGTRFTTAQPGEITSLRYWRGAADADDIDTRVLNLWDNTGALIASTSVTSAAGQSGWQVGVLDTPVQVAAGQEYTVSYGTTQNYVVDQNFFASAYTGPSGILGSPASAGVYAAGGTGAFPTQSYANSNYWVDVGFWSEPIANDAPSFTMGGSSFALPENQTYVTTVTAVDPEGDELVFAISGGDDAALFSLNGSNALVFNSAPDFEAPADLDGDNSYELILSASDGDNPATELAVTVTVDDVAPETGAGVSTLFTAGDAPALTVTNDPTDYELGVKFTSDTGGQVTGLRYWRGTEDAGDTDTRTLNLWDASGTLLASASVTSTPGHDGWQVAALDTPVEILADTTYIASYGTTQNYVASSQFFATDWVGADGELSAVAAADPNGNGVFNSGGTGLFPSQSYNATNYWVDAFVETGDALF